MIASHVPAHLHHFQNLAHRVMSRLISGHAAPEPRPYCAEPHFVGVSLEHWDLLFGAVTERLTLSAQALAAATAEMPAVNPAIGATQASILECVDALTQLRLTMRDSLDAMQR